jgi:hypothetical protein
MGCQSDFVLDNKNPHASRIHVGPDKLQDRVAGRLSE